MLYAAMEKLQTIFPRADFVCRELPGNQKIFKLYELRRQKRQWKVPLNIMPSYITKSRLGFVAEQKIDNVIDAGGLRFTDHSERFYSNENIK